MKSCFFIGHREAPSDILPVLSEAVERHVTEFGVRSFVVGNYGNFDRMAARAVIMAKERYSDILLSLLIPYHPASNARNLVDYAKKCKVQNLACGKNSFLL